jgi:hypothetical protein
VLAHMPHQLYWDSRASLDFFNDYIDLQILEDYIYHDSYLLEFGGVLLHTLPFPFPEAIPMDPLFLYIPNRVETRLNDGF